jgi:uncharacterized membrane protein
MWMGFLLPLHPRFVHFPIALTITGVAMIIVGFLAHRERWIEFGRLSLVLGWAGLLLASLTGLIDESRAPTTPPVQTVINQHITVGISLVVVFGIALYWPLRNRQLWAQPSQRALYLALLVLGAGLVVLDGWLGGKLVYSLGVGVAGR